MQVRRVEYVEASELFTDCDIALEYFWNLASDRFSWGDNNRTLVSKDRMMEAVGELDFSNDSEKDEIETVLERLEKLEEYTYIDLEN